MEHQRSLVFIFSLHSLFMSFCRQVTPTLAPSLRLPWPRSGICWATTPHPTITQMRQCWVSWLRNRIKSSNTLCRVHIYILYWHVWITFTDSNSSYVTKISNNQACTAFVLCLMCVYTVWVLCVCLQMSMCSVLGTKWRKISWTP